MFKFSTNLLPFLFVICVAGAPNFLIFQNINGCEFKVTSNRIETTNGTNFTLICKISNNNDEKLLDRDVFWIEKRGKIKFSNTNEGNDLTIPDVNILKFASVTEKDQGKYVCKSLKHKLFRVVQLIVRNEASDNIVKDLKRHKKYIRETEFEKALKESDKYVQQWKEDLEKQSQASNNYNTGNNYNSNDDLKSYKKNRFSAEENTLLNAIYVLLAAVVIFAIMYGITKCCHDYNNQTNTEDTTSYHLNDPNTRNVNGQNTLLGLNGFYSSQENNLDLPPSYADSTANSATGSTLNLHITDNGLSTRILDANDGTNSVLPPTYEDADDSFSTRIINANDGFNGVQPPTYEDALVNIVLSEPTSNGGGHSEVGRDSGGNTGGGAANNAGIGGDSEEGGCSNGHTGGGIGNSVGRSGVSRKGGDSEGGVDNGKNTGGGASDSGGGRDSGSGGGGGSGGAGVSREENDNGGRGEGHN